MMPGYTLQTLSTPVLDHGYVLVIESWGDDSRIVEAARMSTGGRFRGWGPQHGDDCPAAMIGAEDSDCECPNGPTPGDERLLRYLYTHRHDTPFEFAGLVIEVGAPLFVAREWQRHRTQSYNEASARYAPLDFTHYEPAPSRLLAQDDGNRQAGRAAGAPEMTADAADACTLVIRDAYIQAESAYRALLAAGVPKEIARVVLPMGRYTRFRASANLRNWLAFLSLRLDSAAQWEIRQYAEAVATILRERFPRTMELFDERGR